MYSYSQGFLRGRTEYLLEVSLWLIVWFADPFRRRFHCLLRLYLGPLSIPLLSLTTKSIHRHTKPVASTVTEMSCKLCQSQNQRNLSGEIAIHFPGLKGLDKPIVWVSPKLVVCLDCGFTEFAIPETELRQLAGCDPTAA